MVGYFSKEKKPCAPAGALPYISHISPLHLPYISQAEEAVRPRRCGGGPILALALPLPLPLTLALALAHTLTLTAGAAEDGSEYNLACILTLPCYQRKGYGKP